MLKTALLLLGIVFSGSGATRFLFGVELKCSLNQVFEFTIWHTENDCDIGGFLPCWNSDDQITYKKTYSAYKKLFFYQDGADNGDSGSTYEPYAVIQHNCSTTKSYTKLYYKHKLPETLTDHGLEYMEYSVDLLNKSGEGGHY